jgi:hypothetical protein
VYFVVIPNGVNAKFGFWVQAEHADEARTLVALNVPGLRRVADPCLAQCLPDETHSPEYGAIVEGGGRTYTITRRRPKAAEPAAAVAAPGDPGCSPSFVSMARVIKWPARLPVRAPAS